MADACLKEAKNSFSCRVCYCEVPILFTEQGVDLSFGEIHSASLKKRLTGCDRGVIFAATVGLEIDRLISKYSRISPAKALCLQALGAQRIEALCDVFCEEMKKRAAQNGEFVTPRFSPGYGDLPLAVQRKLFDVLDCSRRIGVMLNESLLMTPTKSVTAIMGLGKDKQ